MEETYAIQTIGLLLIGAAALVPILRMAVRDRKEQQNMLWSAAYRDPLTGFGNEVQLRNETKYLLESDGYRHGGVFISLDVVKFKYINEIFGYETGDKLLHAIAASIAGCLQENETFARIYTDHFAVLLASDKEQAVHRIEGILQKIQQDNPIQQEYYRLSVKAGAYCFAQGERDLNLLIDRASTARRSAKELRGADYVFYTEEMHGIAEKEKELERKMAAALREGQFVPYIQPRYDLFRSKMVGGEMLVRWVDPEKGIRPPDEYIPFFERNGFITEIDRYMFEQVCKKIREWLDAGYEVEPISINVSRRHLEDDHFAGWYGETASRYGIPEGLVELELTESIAFYDMERLREIMGQLKGFGFILSLDDFGSEYSSLNILKSLPVDIVKLDKLFFSTEAENRERIVIESCVDMCHRLGILVICEGVETQEQVDFLRQIGCHLIQGYWFAKPMPLEEYEQMAFPAEEKNRREETQLPWDMVMIE